MTAEQLARETLAVLDLQQSYFKTRNTNTLHESKDAERRLREKCRAILSPRQVQPGLPGMVPDAPPERPSPEPGRHYCGATGCAATVPTEQFVCGFHWRSIPVGLRRTLTETFALWGEGRVSIQDLRAVQAECVAAIEGA